MIGRGCSQGRGPGEAVEDVLRLAGSERDGLDLDRGLSCGGDRRGEVERLGAGHAEAGAQLAKRGVDRRECGRGAPRYGLAEIPTPKALEPEDRFLPFRTVVAG